MSAGCPWTRSIKAGLHPACIHVKALGRKPLLRAPEIEIIFNVPEAAHGPGGTGPAAPGPAWPAKMAQWVPGGHRPFCLHNAPAGPNGTTSMLMAYAGALQSLGCSRRHPYWQHSTSQCHVYPRRHFLAHERGINMGCGICKMGNLSCRHVPGAPCDALHHAVQAM